MTRVATVVDRWGFALFTEGNLVRYCLDIGLCWERLDISWFAQKHCCKFQVGFIRYTVIMLHVNPRMHPNLLETSLQWSKALAHETHYVNNCNCKCNEVWWPVKRLQDWTASITNQDARDPMGIPWLGAFAMKSSAISSASAASSSNVLVQYRIVQCCIATPVIHVHKQKHSKYDTKLLFQDAILWFLY